MSHFLAVEHQPARLHKPTFLLVIVLPQEVPQEKNCCAKPLPGTQRVSSRPLSLL